MQSGAAALIIGNEVLSAKVIEANGAHLIVKLRERGVRLRTLMVVPDEVDPIVEAIMLLRKRSGWLFTSGGIGPTHDDVTVRAVALALGRPVVRLPQIEALVRAHYGERLTPEALRLADAPQGSRLLEQPNARYPVLECDRIFMLPGVPELFRLQLESALAQLPAQPLSCATLFLSASEPEAAHALDAVALALPQVTIGSYPTFDAGADHKVKVTVEHAKQEWVNDAVTRLRQQLPKGSIVREVIP